MIRKEKRKLINFKYFFRLINSSVFGKGMKNLRNRVDIELATHAEKYKPLVS